MKLLVFLMACPNDDVVLSGSAVDVFIVELFILMINWFFLVELLVYPNRPVDLPWRSCNLLSDFFSLMKSLRWR